MVLSLTYSTPPRRCPPSLQESMVCLADNLSKFVASQTALTAQLKINMEKQKQTLAFISSIYQAIQQETNTTTTATPHTGTQQVITPPLNTIKPEIISKPFVTQNTRLCTSPPPSTLLQPSLTLMLMSPHKFPLPGYHLQLPTRITKL